MGPVWLWGGKKFHVVGWEKISWRFHEIFSHPTTKQGHGEVLEKDPIFF